MLSAILCSFVLLIPIVSNLWLIYHVHKLKDRVDHTDSFVDRSQETIDKLEKIVIQRKSMNPHNKDGDVRGKNLRAVQG